MSKKNGKPDVRGEVKTKEFYDTLRARAYSLRNELKEQGVKNKVILSRNFFLENCENLCKFVINRSGLRIFETEADRVFYKETLKKYTKIRPMIDRWVAYGTIQGFTKLISSSEKRSRIFLESKNIPYTHNLKEIIERRILITDNGVGTRFTAALDRKINSIYAKETYISPENLLSLISELKQSEYYYTEIPNTRIKLGLFMAFFFNFNKSRKKDGMYYNNITAKL